MPISPATRHIRAHTIASSTHSPIATLATCVRGCAVCGWVMKGCAMKTYHFSKREMRDDVLRGCASSPVVWNDVSETKKAGCVSGDVQSSSRSAISHANDVRVGQAARADARGQTAARDGVCNSDTHTSTHTKDAKTCNCDTCDGCRWLHEPDAATMHARRGQTRGATGGIAGAAGSQLTPSAIWKKSQGVSRSPHERREHNGSNDGRR